MKIITFTKNNQFQALLQFSDPVNAQQAKLVGTHACANSISNQMLKLKSLVEWLENPFRF